MKQYFFAFAVILAFAACTSDSKPVTVAPGAENALSLVTDAGDGWQYDQLRILPILADGKLIEANTGLQNLKTAEAALQTPGFRITELRQFGRTREQQVNALTVQNKTPDTMLLFSGDVVTGGKQDRVIAQDYVILPASVRNIDVFCVEKNRWQFRGDSLESGDQPEKEKIYAFSGYYNVASPSVRKAVRNGDSQEAVWSAVAKVTSANQATSSTSTYAALDNANEIKEQRDAYLRFFENKPQGLPNMVGMAVVSGDKLLGIDIFAHPDLFKRRFKALLHGYVAEAVTRKVAVPHDVNSAQVRFNTVLRQLQAGQPASDVAGKFEYKGRWIHLYSK